ncbi:MAG: hypothetical protein K1X67_11775 [Fimbriimonadaceae bacterium]|nr:hypothetical protein [Fimbriimonadaceae bacterium]
MDPAITLAEELTGLHVDVRGAEHLGPAIREHRPWSVRVWDADQKLELPMGSEVVGVLILECPNLSVIQCACRLDSLQRLWISDCPLSSLSFVHDMPVLESLSTDRSVITTLDDLIDHDHIRTLFLPNTTATDFFGIAKLPKLSSLNVLNTGCSSLEGLLEGKPMQILSIARTPITSLRGLDCTQEIFSLSVADCHIDNMHSVEGARSLEYLSMRGTRCPDYRFLATLPVLADLELAGSNIAQLDVLADCDCLWSLSVRGTVVPTLLPLVPIESLLFVRISPDMEQLSGVTELKERGVHVMVETYPNRRDRKGFRNGSWTY